MKKNLKKLALVALIAFVMTSCGSKETIKENVDSTKTEATTNSDTLVVGTSAFNGNFVEGFNNNSYDGWVRKLIHSYDTYQYDRYGEVVLNTIVNEKEPEIRTEKNGNKVYKFTLKDNLVWNDGEKITAKDYVFSYMLMKSPEMVKCGGTNQDFQKEIVGLTDYNQGKTRELSGIKYIDEKTFEITIDKKYIPYFYETNLVKVRPMPMHIIAENLDFADSGIELKVKDDYKFTEEDKVNYVKLVQEKYDSLKAEKEDIEKNEEMDKSEKETKIKDLESQMKVVEEDLINVEKEKFDLFNVLMNQAALYTANKYNKKPTVTCGPYNFVKFENETVSLSQNDKFLGNYEGAIPTIKNIVIKTVNLKLDVDLAIAGDIDLAPGVIEGAKIEKAKTAETTDMVSYKRAGYGKISFLSDLGATKHKEVRQAIGYLLDRDMFVQNVLGGYGTIVDGAYGISQWMYKEKGEEFEQKAKHYTLNVEQANKVLDESPYVYEKDGKTKWDANKAKEAYEKDSDKFNYYRYDKDGNKLQVNHCGSTNNIVSDTIQSQLPDNAKKAGMLYSFTATDFATLLNYYYKPDLKKPKFTAFNFATQFNPIYEPYYTMHSSQIGLQNNCRINDSAVDKLVEEMQQLAPDQKDKFAKDWLELQLWFNENLPEIPLYSNEYYDIYNKRITGIDTTPFWDWAQDIADIKINK